MLQPDPQNLRRFDIPAFLMVAQARWRPAGAPEARKAASISFAYAGFA